MKRLVAWMGGLALLGAAGAAGAVPITVDVAGSPSSSVTEDGWNFTAALVSGLDNTQFTLTDGQSVTFDFFDVNITSGTWGAYDASVNATLAFQAPLVSSSDVGTAEYRNFYWLGTLYRDGSLDWGTNNTDTFTVGGDVFSVRLNDAIWTGTHGVVTATVTNDIGGAAAPVPEPGTLMLLGTGLASLAGNGRRRMKK